MIIIRAGRALECVCLMESNETIVCSNYVDFVLPVLVVMRRDVPESLLEGSREVIEWCFQIGVEA